MTLCPVQYSIFIDQAYVITDNQKDKNVCFALPDKYKICYFCTELRGVVQLASMLAWGASGRPFESGHSDRKSLCRKGLFL